MDHQPTQFKFSPLVGITGLKVAVEDAAAKGVGGVGAGVGGVGAGVGGVGFGVGGVGAGVGGVGAGVAKVVVMLVVELDDVVLVVVTTFVALQEASPVLEIFEANNGNVTVCVSEVKSVYFSSTVKDFPRGLPP